MPETKLTQKQLNDLKNIYATLEESNIANDGSDAWKAIIQLGWLIDDLAGVGVRTWSR